MAPEHYNNWPNSSGFNATTEQVKPRQLKVSGILPSYVSGSLYRTGPGFYKVASDDPDGRQFACSHCFDGFTTMHKFDISSESDGRCSVSYTSRRQVDELVAKALESGKLDGVTFGQKRDPCDTFYKKIKTVFEPVLDGGPQRINVGVDIRPTLPGELKGLNNKSTNQSVLGPVQGIERLSVLSATTDSRVTKQFDADTLEPLGVCRQVQLHPSLRGPLSGAHAQIDRSTSEIFNYNLEFSSRTTYRIFASSIHTGETRILAEVSGSDIYGAYIHSMLLTKSFIILCIWPAYFANRGANILWERNLMDALAKFDKSSKTIWLVIDRHHGRGVMKKFTSAPFFCFHTVNAWEEMPADGKMMDVFCQLVQFPNMDILHRFYYANLVSDGRGVHNYAGKKTDAMAAHLAQYRLSGVPIVSPQSPTETPAARSESATATLVCLVNHGSWEIVLVDGIVKTDTKTKTSVVWEHPKHTPGEPVFVANPAERSEDDGVILCIVLDGERGTSYLLCLDAMTMKEIARADVENAVGLGFNGAYIPKHAAD